MQTFGERLVAARNAKSMTQEALAQAVNVTRSTISSWERGRTLPDVEMIRRLSDALECDFIQLAAGEEALQVENEAPSKAEEVKLSESEEIRLPETQPETSSASKARRSRISWIIAAACVLLCVCVALILARNHATSIDDDAMAAFMRYYSQEIPDEAGTARILFQNTQWEETGDSAVYMRYAFELREQNGVAFDITNVDFKVLAPNRGQDHEGTLSSSDLEAANVNTHIAPRGSTIIDGGFPKGQFVAVGMEVHGIDENGTEQTFYSMIEF